MLKKIRGKTKKANDQKGFTLLEILVVLTIMGFLIAMVAPRLADISGSATATVCDSSKYRIKTYMSSFYEQFNRYPNLVTNLVMADGATLAAANAAAAGYQIPYCSNDDPDDGPEVLAYGHNKMYKFMIHRLNAAEASELINMGITTVLNLNDYAADADGLDGAAADGRETSTGHDSGRVSNWANITEITAKMPSNQICAIEAGVGVAMCGCGIDRAGTDLTYVQAERGWAEEDIFARMIFGLGPESELVTSGIVNNAAHCPGSIQNADNFTCGIYYLILPRLEATADRLADTTNVTFASLWGSGNLDYARLSANTLEAVSWPKAGPKPSTGYNITANADHFKVRTGLNLHAAMEPWDYDTNRNRNDEVWGIDLIDPNHRLNGG